MGYTCNLFVIMEKICYLEGHIFLPHGIRELYHRTLELKSSIRINDNFRGPNGAYYRVVLRRMSNFHDRCKVTCIESQFACFSNSAKHFHIEVNVYTPYSRESNYMV